MHLHETIVCAIRDDILSGRLRPGERLPPRTAFEQRFATTPVTVQRAFARLIADGFVKALPKQGTFVADPPPHLREYNLLIYSHRTPPLWGNKFWATLDRVAAEISRTTSRRVRIRTGVTPEHPQDDSYRELVYDIRAKRLAGIAFLFGPGLAHDSLLLGAKDLPKVSLMAHSIPGLPQIVLNGRHYWEKALDHLQREGRNRVAIFMASGVDASVWAQVRKGAKARGMTCEDRWIQAVDLAYPHWASNVTELLLS